MVVSTDNWSRMSSTGSIPVSAVFLLLGSCRAVPVYPAQCFLGPDVARFLYQFKYEL